MNFVKWPFGQGTGTQHSGVETVSWRLASFALLAQEDAVHA